METRLHSLAVAERFYLEGGHVRVSGHGFIDVGDLALMMYWLQFDV
jgi:hypothetical protein